MHEGKIILIKEILNQRKEKQKELEFYLSKKIELENKLSFIRRELALTDKILQLIESEKIEELLK